MSLARKGYGNGVYVSGDRLKVAHLSSSTLNQEPLFKSYYF